MTFQTSTEIKSQFEIKLHRDMAHASRPAFSLLLDTCQNTLQNLALIRRSRSVRGNFLCYKESLAITSDVLTPPFCMMLASPLRKTDRRQRYYQAETKIPSDSRGEDSQGLQSGSMKIILRSVEAISPSGNHFATDGRQSVHLGVTTLFGLVSEFTLSHLNITPMVVMRSSRCLVMGRHDRFRQRKIFTRYR